jgi:hypothetical protein
MSTVESQVRDVRARLRRAAGLGAAVRWSLYGALIAGGWLIAARFLGWPRGPLWAVLALPAVAGIAAAARRLDLRQAAAMIDRALGLEERVATAFEGATGPFGSAVAVDAARSLDPARAASVGRFHWPVEARFLIPAVALVVALAFLPESGRQIRSADPELRSAVDPDVDRLVRVPIDDPVLAAKVRDVLADLKSDDLKRMAAGAEAARRLAAEVRMNLGTAAGSDRENLKQLADRLEAAGTGTSSQLARRGIEVPEVAPIDLEARLAAARARGDLAMAGGRPEAGDVASPVAGTAIPVDVRRDIERRLAVRPVDPRYVETVRRYYERLDSRR